MVKKATTKKAGAKARKSDDNQLAAAIRDSAQQIWLAGMGAFAKARAERTKIFDALVKEGHNIQLRTRALAEERMGEVSGKVNTQVGQQGHERERIDACSNGFSDFVDFGTCGGSEPVLVVPTAAREPIVPAGTHQGVISIAAVQVIGSRVAFEIVRPSPTFDDFEVVATVDHNVA